MYILYLDDAGTVENRMERHFVLAGQAIFERQAHWLQIGLDRIAARTGHENPDTLELHGNEILGARKGSFWRHYRDRPGKRQVILDALDVGKGLQGVNPMFGIVAEKSVLSPEDPVAFAFEQICARFDAFLTRQYHQGNPQRGLVILDRNKKQSGETRLQAMATDFRRLGHTWGVVRNLADVPLFADSRATRGLQLADLIAYALWRAFEKSDKEFFDRISDSFDAEGGVVHGLLHRHSPMGACDCPYCRTRGSRT